MPFVPPSPLDNERVQAKEREARHEAAQYAQRHPGESTKGASSERIRRVVGRLRAALTRSK
jgi:hypothetical protein